jgi:hypothetical protein
VEEPASDFVANAVVENILAEEDARHYFLFT